MGHNGYSFLKTSVGDCFYLCFNFVFQLVFDVLVGSLREDQGDDTGSWIHVNSTFTRKLVWPTLINFHPH